MTHVLPHLNPRDRRRGPVRFLQCTFTNKAAAEMRERIDGLLGEASQDMWVSTFHSACVRILRREAERFGYVAGFTIYDAADSRALLKRIIKGLDADTYGFTPANSGSKISRLKNELSDADTYAATMNESDPAANRLFVEIFKMYEQELRRANAFDFDDLIGQTVHLFRAHPDVAAIYQRRFRHILVDEYQDTTHAQYSLIRELTKPVAPEEVERLVPPARPRDLDEMGRIPGASLTVVASRAAWRSNSWPWRGLRRWRAIEVDPVKRPRRSEGGRDCARGRAFPEGAGREGRAGLPKACFASLARRRRHAGGVNPLVLTGAGEIIALDGKVSLDENADFRQPGHAELEDKAAEDPLEAKAKAQDLNYVKLDGEVGVIGNGAGLVMSTLDVVAYAGEKHGDVKPATSSTSEVEPPPR
ncbi:hypothetical protein FQA39_LY18873 [Lamprigera yunnana]|nr:hypothetical protein FQA39_LY18873 [Lamprigera yunnana]